MQLSDENICALLQRRDIKGLEQLFELYYNPLVLWADSFLDDMNRSEDLVQDLFVKLWEKEMYKGFLPEMMKSYLFASVRNQCFNHIKRRDPLKRAYDVTQLQKPWEEYDDCREELLKDVEHEIEKLPARSREIVTEIYLKGKPYKEVAEKFNISLSTVKTLLAKSVREIRKNSTANLIVTLFFWMKGSIPHLSWPGRFFRN